MSLQGFVSSCFKALSIWYHSNRCWLHFCNINACLSLNSTEKRRCGQRSRPIGQISAPTHLQAFTHTHTNMARQNLGSPLHSLQSVCLSLWLGTDRVTQSTEGMRKGGMGDRRSYRWCGTNRTSLFSDSLWLSVTSSGSLGKTQPGLILWFNKCGKEMPDIYLLPIHPIIKLGDEPIRLNWTDFKKVCWLYWKWTQAKIIKMKYRM